MDFNNFKYYTRPLFLGLIIDRFLLRYSRGLATIGFCESILLSQPQDSHPRLLSHTHSG